MVLTMSIISSNTGYLLSLIPNKTIKPLVIVTFPKEILFNVVLFMQLFNNINLFGEMLFVILLFAFTVSEGDV